MNIINRQNKAINADKTGGLIGKKWGKVYNGYFVNPEIVQFIIDSCDEIIEELPTDKTLKILEIGAGTGIVGEAVNNYLNSKNIRSKLIISDRIKEHLQVNKNIETKQIVFDNKKIPFADKSRDLVLSRSVTHYESTKTQEMLVLKEVKRILTDKGFFISQSPTFASPEESSLLINIHNLVGKSMNLQSTHDVENMLKEIFQSVKISKSQPPSISVSMKGFLKRYNIQSPKKEEMVEQIIKLISVTREDLRPDVRILDNGFEWEIPYTIFICQK